MALGTSRRFEETVLCHLDVVYRVARSLSRDANEADDLVQETFLRAHKAFDRFEMREFGAKPWLLKILHNVFATHRGHAWRVPSLTDDMRFDEIAAELESPDPELVDITKLGHDHLDDELNAALQKLPHQYRAVLVLWALGDLSYKEIGDSLGVAMGTVMSRLHRARQLLSVSLAEYAVKRGIRPQTMSKAV